MCKSLLSFIASMRRHMAENDTVRLTVWRKRGGSSMVRMSALRNCPVICQNRQIGLLQSVRLDAAQKRVQALVVSCGLRGKCVVLGRQIQAVTDAFILAEQTERYRRAYEEKGSSFVRDTTGMLAGCITDYALDERTLAVQAIEILPGYWPASCRKRLWAFAFHHAEEPDGSLIVPASLGSELIFQREGT